MPDYIRPENRSEALQRLSEPDSRPVVLGPRLRPYPYAGASTLVDLSALGLAEVVVKPDEIRLGGLTPLAEIAQLPALTDGPARVLAEAAALAAQPGLLRVATLAGALGTTDGAPELRLALLALDAAVIVETAAGQARQAADALLAPNALVAEVVLPRSAGRTALARVARAPRDLAIVAAVAWLSLVDGVCQGARLAIAGAGRAGRVTAAEQALVGGPVTEATLEAAAKAARDAADPLGDFRGTAEYRREMAGVLARRAAAAAAAA